ncbi:MAG: nickel-dependent hydrogenase large subunit [Ectothiorhodospiraceae bacterium]|nr:nickel-dependent hydrogenase large subunit [Ectothiorhodospiraceae bacterium]
MTERTVDIRVPILARVEGEGALHLAIRAGAIETLQLRIYEPPRLFERFLVGRSFTEVPDMVARICGICPVAYQISAVNALEDAFEVDPGPWVRDMRRVLYCGEWIQSHCLHIHLLAAPDFLGYADGIAMARDHGEVVRRGLALQALGNDLMRMLGGRSVHPVGVRVGGFHRAPEVAEVDAMLERLEAARADALALVEWTATLPLPDDRQDFDSVALRHRDEYPMHAGRIVSDRGLDLDVHDYERHFVEEHREQSTALFSLLDGAPYLVGPLARLNLARDQLPEPLRARLPARPSFPSTNMFDSIVARAIETAFAIGEAARLLGRYRRPDAPAVAVTPREAVGIGASEAPRGLLWHRYETDAAGLVRHARIVPPTSQNQARIEQDLHASLAAFGLDHDDDALRLRCEQVIRNYDPCISCATHFLRLTTERS